MQRFAVRLEYDGRPFKGWQSQRVEASVQDVVEAALAKVADQDIRVICAGRTDTGVHALGQIVHFDAPVERTTRQWLLGTNRHLPDSVVAHWFHPVSDNFHARFSAFERSYRYVILNRSVRPAVRAGLVSWYRRSLDAALMHQAAQVLLGEHDFSAFRSAGCGANHAVREVSRISVRRQDDEVALEIAANGFLYHMVRNIAGSLLDIGCGEKPAEWMAELLKQRDRKLAGVMAKPDGLYFKSVRYPSEFELPESENDPSAKADPGSG